MRRNLPLLTLPPDPRAGARATTLLAFVEEIRSSANYAGFSAVHARTLEAIGAMLDHYVDDVLDRLKTGDVEDVQVAQALLAVAADFYRVVRGDDAAALVRRRTVVACQAEGACSPLADTRGMAR
jgi:hypothetical protein